MNERERVMNDWDEKEVVYALGCWEKDINDFRGR